MAIKIVGNLSDFFKPYVEKAFERYDLRNLDAIDYVCLDVLACMHADRINRVYSMLSVPENVSFDDCLFSDRLREVGDCSLYLSALFERKRKLFLEIGKRSYKALAVSKSFPEKTDIFYFLAEYFDDCGRGLKDAFKDIEFYASAMDSLTRLLKSN